MDPRADASRTIADHRESRRLRCVVAEDGALFRAGIVRLLVEDGIEVVAEAVDRDGLLAAVAAEEPDVVVTDIRMPPTGTTEGLDAALEIRRGPRPTAVVVLSQYVETRHALGLLEGGAGGVGYLLKDRVIDTDEFLETVRRVAAGGSAIDRVVVDRLFERGRDEDRVAGLSEREREVLALMAEGRSNRGICDALFLSAKTVETHVGAIMSKLGLEQEPTDHRRVLAVLAHLRAAPE